MFQVSYDNGFSNAMISIIVVNHMDKNSIGCENEYDQMSNALQMLGFISYGT